jgi:hypothetical protein
VFPIIFVFVQQGIAVAVNNIQHLLNFVPVKRMAGFNPHGVQPNLGYTVAIPGDMAMSSFALAIALPLVDLDLKIVVHADFHNMSSLNYYLQKIAINNNDI